MKKLFLILIVTVLFLSVAFSIKAQEASFYVSPSTGNYQIGNIFKVDVFVNSNGAPINAAQAKITFSPAIIEVISVSKTGSIFNLWFQNPVFSNSKGEISFGGGLPSPGFQGSAGKLMSITFRAKAKGQAKLDFHNGSIIENGPTGKNIFSFSKEGKYSIVAPRSNIKNIESKNKNPALIVEDNTPPKILKLFIDNEGDPTNPNPLLYIKSQDDLSGVDYYKIKIGEGDYFPLSIDQSYPFKLPHQDPGEHSLSIEVFDKAGNVSNSSIKFFIEPLLPPEITVCPQSYVPERETLYIEGKSIPKASVLLFLKRKGKLEKIWTTSSDEAGRWFVRKNDLLRSDNYVVTARVKDYREAISNPSRPAYFHVPRNGFVFMKLFISYKVISYLLEIILILVLIGFLYLIYKARKDREDINFESNDLKNKFLKEYKELEADIQNELKTHKNNLSSEEIERRNILLKDLVDVKEVVEKELKDIENIK